MVVVEALAHGRPVVATTAGVSKMWWTTPSAGSCPKTRRGGRKGASACDIRRRPRTRRGLPDATSRAFFAGTVSNRDHRTSPRGTKSVTFSPAPDPILSVVVVTYNSAAIVSTALTPLLDKDGVEVIVVDNASTDETVNHVRAAHPHVEVVRSPSNGGFASGVNQGIARAQGSVVLLLNPDAVVEWRDVQLCLQVFAANSNVGVVAPRTLQPQGRQAILDAGREPTVCAVSLMQAVFRAGRAGGAGLRVSTSFPSR